jgi:uncharacterized membrane protein
MIARLRSLLLRLAPGRLRRAFEGFWTVPLAVAAVGPAAVALLDLAPTPGVRIIDALDAVPRERADGVLGLVAGAVLSVASIVFSLSFVALSATAGALSPRMLDFVIRDRAMQLLIGGALGAFLFAGVVMLTGEARDAWRQALAAALSLGWAALVLATVVIFAHRMTRVIRPDEMVARRGDAFRAAVLRQCETPTGCAAATPSAAAALERAMAAARPLRVRAGGYAGSIDLAGLVAFAAARDAAIRLDALPNDYLLPGAAWGAAIGVDPDCDDALQAMLGMTDRRAPATGPIYEAQTLSEAALRALSPGINDPATGMACADRLFEGIVLCAVNEAPVRALADGQGRVRLLRACYGVSEMLETAAAPILHYGRDDPAIRAHLARLTGVLVEAARRPDDRAAAEAFLRRINA